MGVRQFTKKKKDGSPYLIWGFDYRDESGKRYRNESCKTKGKAELEYKKFLLGIEEQKKPIDKKLTFADLAESFIESHAKVHCSKATQNKYESLNKIHLKPFFGEKKAADIRMNDINELIKELQGKELSEKSINHALQMTKTVFNYAISNEILMNNPCKKVKKLRLPHKEKNFLTENQVKILLEKSKTESPSLYPILYMAIFTGMRKGEVSALTWKDIDFKSKKISINKSMYKNEIQKTKTEHSIRKVDMIDSLADVLSKYRQNTPLRGEYVFWGESGTPLSGDATLWRHFNGIITKCGLKDLTFHDLRHTYAALLIKNNVPIKYIQKQLGHSTIKMTMDTYGHLMPEVSEAAVNVLENIAKAQNGRNLKQKNPEAL